VQAPAHPVESVVTHLPAYALPDEATATRHEHQWRHVLFNFFLKKTYLSLQNKPQAFQQAFLLIVVLA
jgi:hypothetical protein